MRDCSYECSYYQDRDGLLHNGILTELGMINDKVLGEIGVQSKRFTSFGIAHSLVAK